jgi:mevalonate kinase
MTAAVASAVAAPAAPAREHRAFGKLILFGEHFVVYHKPALVCAVKAATVAEVELSSSEWSTGLLVEDLRPAVPGYKDEKAHEMLESMRLVLGHFGVDSAKRGVKIVLKGDLAPVSGIGASAANCVSVARALAAALGRSCSEAEINRAGFVGETAYHGTPSGIDNTASTYGGVLRFQRTAGDPLFETRALGQEILIVYASTGITSSTTKVVGDVRAKREADPAWYAALEQRYMAVFDAAERAIAANEPGLARKLAQLALENHQLCQELTVSCKELDDMCAVAMAAGALGAKMSGTGRGGLMFAICEDVASQDAVAAALGKVSPQVWKTAFA